MRPGYAGKENTLEQSMVLETNEERKTNQQREVEVANGSHRFEKGDDEEEKRSTSRSLMPNLTHHVNVIGIEFLLENDACACLFRSTCGPGSQERDYPLFFSFVVNTGKASVRVYAMSFSRR